MPDPDLPPDPQKTRSFRWRLIPATFFFLCGPLAVLSGITMGLFAIYINLRYGLIIPHPETPTLNDVAFTFANITFWQLTFWSGVFGIGAALAWLRGRWRIAWFLTGLWWLVSWLSAMFRRW